MTAHRKTVRHYHQLDACRELTFSCYQRLPLLNNDLYRIKLCEAIDRAIVNHRYRNLAFVIMPDHVHLFLYPMPDGSPMEDLLYAIKRPFSFRIKKLMEKDKDPLLPKLTIRERPGKMTFRFWQEGPGYDRNIRTVRGSMNVIDYFHLNPVRRGLVTYARDWKWSSARWYESDGEEIDPQLPIIHGLPWEFL